jgi:hypothetical protein
MQWEPRNDICLVALKEGKQTAWRRRNDDVHRLNSGYIINSKILMVVVCINEHNYVVKEAIDSD